MKHENILVVEKSITQGKISMKIFILTAGDQYYPQSGTSDWIDSFTSESEAQKEIETIGSGENQRFLIRGNDYDWYEIIDLTSWISR